MASDTVWVIEFRHKGHGPEWHHHDDLMAVSNEDSANTLVDNKAVSYPNTEYRAWPYDRRKEPK